MADIYKKTDRKFELVITQKEQDHIKKELKKLDIDPDIIDKDFHQVDFEEIEIPDMVIPFIKGFI